MPTLPKKSFIPKYAPQPAVNQRATGDQAFYNSLPWRKCSQGYRQNHPLCENCKDKSRLTEAHVVDHVIPMPHGEGFAAENFMSLCHRCHNQKSGKEGHAGGPLIAHAGGLPVDRNEIFKILT